ncbi:hypothetical protein [Pantoea allii]
MSEKDAETALDKAVNGVGKNVFSVNPYAMYLSLIRKPSREKDDNHEG